MPTGIFLSFGHALRGLVEVTARERNMKIHVLCGTAVGLLGAEVAMPVPSRLALLFAVVLVVAAEMGNSALEALVDLHTRELRDEARRVKDAAAGGVLVLALGAVLLEGFLLFGRSGSALLDGIAILVGALLVGFLGLNGLSGSLSLAAALLFALASASAIASRARNRA
jgi:diacylglycerol kinase